MYSMSRTLAVAAAFTLLAACGGSKNTKQDFDYGAPQSDANKRAELSVPPDLIRPVLDGRYVVPAAPASNVLRAGAAESAGNAAAVPAQPASSGNLSMERYGNQRWLVVRGARKADLWPMLESFWKDMGIVLAVNDPQLGVMETDWAENRAKIKSDPIQRTLSTFLGSIVSSGEMDKYRLRLESAAQPGVYEIYISHRAMEEVAIGASGDIASRQTRWDHRPSDPGLESGLLQRLMLRLGADEKTAQKMVAATETPAPERAQLAPAADGVLQLTLSEPMDRAWRQVGSALDRSGVVVEDRDRAKGLYFVRYITSEEDGKSRKDSGLLASWFSKSEVKSTTDQFRVEVRAEGAQTLVRLLNKEGVAAPAAVAKQILGLLHSELK